MPMWAVVYSVLVIDLGIWAAVEEAREGRDRRWIGADVATTAVWVWFIAVYYIPAFEAPLGRWLVPLFVANLLTTGISVHQEIVGIDQNPDPNLSPRANLVGDHLGIALATFAMAPALVCGALAAQRAW